MRKMPGSNKPMISPGIGFFDNIAVLRQELLRLRQLNIFAKPNMLDGHAPLEFTGNDPQESNAVAVGRVHIRLNFEHIA